MEQQTGNKGNTTQNTSESVKETHSNGSNLVSIEPIEGSPFTLVKDMTDHDPLTDRGAKIFIALGQYRLTEAYETEDEAMEQFVIQPWNMTVTLITAVVEKMEQMKRINGQIPVNTEEITIKDSEGWKK